MSVKASFITLSGLFVLAVAAEALASAPDDDVRAALVSSQVEWVTSTGEYCDVPAPPTVEIGPEETDPGYVVTEVLDKENFIDCTNHSGPGPCHWTQIQANGQATDFITLMGSPPGSSVMEECTPDLLGIRIPISLDVAYTDLPVLDPAGCGNPCYATRTIRVSGTVLGRAISEVDMRISTSLRLGPHPVYPGAPVFDCLTETGATTDCYCDLENVGPGDDHSAKKRQIGSWYPPCGLDAPAPLGAQFSDIEKYMHEFVNGSQEPHAFYSLADLDQEIERAVHEQFGRGGGGLGPIDPVLWGPPGVGDSKWETTPTSQGFHLEANLAVARASSDDQKDFQRDHVDLPTGTTVNLKASDFEWSTDGGSERIESIDAGPWGSASCAGPVCAVAPSAAYGDSPLAYARCLDFNNGTSSCWDAGGTARVFDLTTAIVDLEHGGPLDIIRSERSKDELSLQSYRASGNGQFAFPPAQFPAGYDDERWWLYDLFTGDFTGDGLGDALIAGWGVSVARLVVGLGEPGSTSFSMQPEQVHFRDWSGFEATVGDFNGDGIDDLAFVRQDSAGISLLVAEGRPDGVFALTPERTHSLASWSEGTVLAGDLDADGDDDLVIAPVPNYPHDVAEPPEVLVVLLESGAPQFQPVQSGLLVPRAEPLSTYDVHLADVTGDGRVDLVSNEKGTANRWRVARAAISFPGLLVPAPIGLRSDTQWAPYSWDPYETLLGDVDGDGAADMVWNARFQHPNGVDTLNRTWVGISTADGAFEWDRHPPQDHPGDLRDPGSPDPIPEDVDWTQYSVHLGDVDGDVLERADLVFSSNRNEDGRVFVALGRWNNSSDHFQLHFMDTQDRDHLELAASPDGTSPPAPQSGPRCGLLGIEALLLVGLARRQFRLAP